MVAAGGRDLERPAGLLLTDNLGEIGLRGVPFLRRLRRLDDLRRIAVAQILHHLAEGRCGDDLEPRHDSGLAGVGGRDDDLLDAAIAGCERHREHPPHRLELTFEGQLAEQQPSGQTGAGQVAGCGQEADGHCEIERRALLPFVRRREIDDHVGRLEAVADTADGGEHPVLRLADRGVGKTHHRHRRRLGPDPIHLHGDEQGSDPARSRRQNLREHCSLLDIYIRRARRSDGNRTLAELRIANYELSASEIAVPTSADHGVSQFATSHFGMRDGWAG